MKKLWALCLIFALLCGGPALAYWEPDRALECREDNRGCLVLQMVMTGSFAQFDPEDSLGGRMLSAALDSVCGVDEAQMEHFCEEFDTTPEEFLPYYYTAVGNCLWADILYGGDVDARTESMHRVLLLFLNPGSVENAQEQMEAIRSRIQDDLILQMAQTTGVSEDFVRYLIFSGSWRVETETVQ